MVRLGGCFLGCLVGITTTALISMHMHTSADVPEDPSGGYLQQLHDLELYVEARVEDVFNGVDDEESDDDEADDGENDQSDDEKKGSADDDDSNRASEELISDTHETSSTANDLASLAATQGPTSSIIVVAPLDTGPAPTPAPPSAAHSLLQVQQQQSLTRDSILPEWIARQLPCAGTGSQYCARTLTPAVLPPILTSEDRVEEVPSGWLAEVKERRLARSLRSQLLTALDRSTVRATAVCPPSERGCRGSAPDDDSVATHGSGESVGGLSEQGDECSALQDRVKSAWPLSSGSSSLSTSAATSLFVDHQIDALLSSSGGSGAGLSTNGGVVFTVLTDLNLDLSDELAATAQRLGYAVASSTYPDPAPHTSSSSTTTTTRYLVVAVGPGAAAAACRAGLATVLFNAPPPPSSSPLASGHNNDDKPPTVAVGVSATFPPAASGSSLSAAAVHSLATWARSEVSRSLARNRLGLGGGGGLDGGGGGAWFVGCDVWLLRNPTIALARSLPPSAGAAALSSSVDMAVGLSMMPDPSLISVNNPHPDPGLYWVRGGCPKAEAFFAALAGEAKADAVATLGRFYGGGKRGEGKGGAGGKAMTADNKWWAGYSGVGGGGGPGGTLPPPGAGMGGIDERGEAAFSCAVRSLPKGPWTLSNVIDANTQQQQYQYLPLSPAMADALRVVPAHCATTSSTVSNSAFQGLTWAALDPRLVIVDDRHPRPHPSAVAVRVPGGGNPEGRAAIKELGLWEGANCYYCIGDLNDEENDDDKGPMSEGGGKGARKSVGSLNQPQKREKKTTSRRYLVYDGIVATNALSVYHRFPMTAALLSELVALAFATDRILVLPALLQMQKWMHAWEVVDVAVLNRVVSWRPSSFFDHLAARGHSGRAIGGSSSGGGGGGDSGRRKPGQSSRGQQQGRGSSGERFLHWNSSKVTAAQLMLKGRQGSGVRRLVDAPPDRQPAARWFKTQGTVGGLRVGEWAVSRNSEETRDATLLFVKIRRSSDALVLQQCATNPAVLCDAQQPKSQGWLEFPLFRALHWCHHRTQLSVANPMSKDKGGDSKREWEHYDRYKTGSFIKPVDECAWPKPFVWPLPPKSLTSFSISGGGGGGGRKSGGGGGKKTSEKKVGAWSWAAAVTHPCFTSVAVNHIVAAASAAGTASGGHGNTDEEARDESALSAVSVALWMRNEWSNNAAEETESKWRPGPSPSSSSPPLPELYASAVAAAATSNSFPIASKASRGSGSRIDPSALRFAAAAHALVQATAGVGDALGDMERSCPKELAAAVEKALAA